MNKQPLTNINWAELGFSYIKCPYRFQAIWQDGSWNEGELITAENVILHEGSTSLHYSQQCFEGLKAQQTPSGKILLFRPQLNAVRMHNTATRLSMPVVPSELFISAIKKTIMANREMVPPYGSNASLYIRPLLIGVGENIGIKPAPKYEFRVFVTPVGAYYKSTKIKPITLKIADVDRVPTHGIGQYKAGANYAGVMKIQAEAKIQGADELLFLDAKEHKYIEEAGSANVVIFFKNQTFATPKSNTILPSVTRQSVMQIAEKMLKLSTIEREIDFYQEIANIEEMANCGTAAVISPVGKIFNSAGVQYIIRPNEDSPVMLKIREILTSIQNGSTEDIFNWTMEVN